jgi:hypothetical protein
MLIRRFTNTLMLAALIAALSGCPSRPYFRFVDPTPDGMAMVYVYRPRKISVTHHKRCISMTVRSHRFLVLTIRTT